MYVCVELNHSAVHQKLTQHFNQLYFSKINFKKQKKKVEYIVKNTER